jgi:hypothetical protein
LTSLERVNYAIDPKGVGCRSVKSRVVRRLIPCSLPLAAAADLARFPQAGAAMSLTEESTAVDGVVLDQR